MTQDEREKLIESMARAICSAGGFDNEDDYIFYGEEAEACLSVAEEAIRKDCAEIAKDWSVSVHGDDFDEQHVNEIASSIAPEIATAILASIPEKQ